MAEYTYDILAAGIEQGTIGQVDDETSDSRVRSSGYVELIDNIISVSVTASCSTSKTISVAFRGYSSADKNSLICNLYWYDCPHTFDLSSYNNIKYFRLVFKYSDNSNIVPSEITSATLVETYRPAWQIENNIFTHEALPTMIPMLVQPYPPGVWWLDNDTFKHTALPDMIPMFVHPYPPGIWYLDNDIFKQDALPNMANSGAFKDCANLYTAIFPSTLTYIGPYAFSGTALTDVTLPDGCRYFDTSFPPRCVVHGGHRE